MPLLSLKIIKKKGTRVDILGLYKHRNTHSETVDEEEDILYLVTT